MTWAGRCAGSGGRPGAEVGGAAPGGGDQDAEGTAAAGSAQAAGWCSAAGWVEAVAVGLKRLLCGRWEVMGWWWMEYTFVCV